MAGFQPSQPSYPELSPPIPVPPPVWHSGKHLVCVKGASLPTDRCVKCDQPSDGKPVMRKLAWHEPGLALLILIGVLVYVIVVLIVDKRARVTFGVCRRHRVRRRWAIFCGWMSIPIGFAIGYAGAVASRPELMLAGFAAFLVLAITGGTLAPFLSASKIDDHYVTLKGCGPEYLRNFPEGGRP